MGLELIDYLWEENIGIKLCVVLLAFYIACLLLSNNFFSPSTSGYTPEHPPLVEQCRKMRKIPEPPQPTCDYGILKSQLADNAPSQPPIGGGETADGQKNGSSKDHDGTAVEEAAKEGAPPESQPGAGGGNGKNGL